MLAMASQRWTKRRERVSHPAFVVQGSCQRTSSPWCGANVDGKKKSDEEAKKKGWTEKNASL
jgi:hypothetical protein